MEHNLEYAQKLQREAERAGVNNIVMCLNPLKDGFYDISEDMAEMPDKFALGVLDGPPRGYGDRMKFFEVFGDKCGQIVVDDADDKGYAANLQSWADDTGRDVKFSQMRVALVA
jgi:hypothetical protein